MVAELDGGGAVGAHSCAPVGTNARDPRAMPVSPPPAQAMRMLVQLFTTEGAPFALDAAPYVAVYMSAPSAAPAQVRLLVASRIFLPQSFFSCTRAHFRHAWAAQAVVRLLDRPSASVAASSAQWLLRAPRRRTRAKRSLTRTHLCRRQSGWASSCCRSSSSCSSRRSCAPSRSKRRPNSRRSPSLTRSNKHAYACLPATVCALDPGKRRGAADYVFAIVSPLG